MKSGGNTMRVAKIVAQQLKAQPAGKQKVQQTMVKVRAYVTANKTKLLAEADTKYASDTTKRAAQKAAINKLVAEGPAKMRYAELPDFVKAFVSKHFTPAEYAAAYPAQVTPLPNPVLPQNDAALMEAVRKSGSSVLANNCSDVKGVDCNKVGNVAKNVAILKTVKWSQMGSLAKEQFKKVLVYYINKNAGLKAKYRTVDDAFMQKVYAAAKFGTEASRVPPRRVEPTEPDKTEKTEKKLDDGKLGKLIIMGAIGFGVGNLKIETTMPEPDTKPNQSEIWQINFDAGAKYRISKNFHVGGQIGGWYNKFKRFDTDSGIGKTSPGGSIWGIHLGPAVAYQVHRKVLIDAALMIGYHQAKSLNLGVLGKGKVVKSVHLAVELGVKYLLHKHIWVGAAVQAIVGLGEAFGSEIKSDFPGVTGFAKMTGVQGMIKLGFSYDFLK